jgi:hypothetical protein
MRKIKKNKKSKKDKNKDKQISVSNKNNINIKITTAHKKEVKHIKPKGGIIQMVERMECLNIQHLLNIIHQHQ